MKSECMFEDYIISLTIDYIPNHRIPRIPNSYKWRFIASFIPCKNSFRNEIYVYAKDISTLRLCYQLVSELIPHYYEESSSLSSDTVEQKFNSIKRTIIVLFQNIIVVSGT